ncbi:MAG: STAS/SEC14 domain-containing protein [Candidatus Omnitrophota bacterium]
MGIKKLYHEHTNVFGFEIDGRLTVAEIEKFLPELEEAVEMSRKKLRLLVDVTKMAGANLKSEWEIFEFLKKHINDIEFIAIVGAHSWTKVMSEILSESVFVMAETLYFKPEQIEQAWAWLTGASHPRRVPVQKYIHSDKGLFTKYGSPDYI